MLSQDDKKFVMEWLAALRSGQYRQTEGILQCGAEYCCLGVACAVSGLKLEVDKYDKMYGITLDAQPSVLALFDRLGLNSGGAPQGGPYMSPPLWELNDTHGLKFPQIADFIEITYGNEWGL